MKAAAEQRFWAGLCLATTEAGHEASAIYLWGYVAEMLLKAAYCEFTQKPPCDDVYGPLKTEIKSANLHSLRGLGVFLIDTRAQFAPMDAAVAGDLLIRIQSLETHWNVAMRYSSVPATESELEDVYESIRWIRSAYADLWS